MRPRLRLASAFATAIVAGCGANPTRHTLADLGAVKPDVAEVEVQDSLDLAMQSYRRYLDQSKTSAIR